MRFVVFLAMLGACTDSSGPPDFGDRRFTDCGVRVIGCEFMSRPVDYTVACMNQNLNEPNAVGTTQWDLATTLDTESYKIWFAADGHAVQYNVDRNYHWTKIGECTGTFHAGGTCPDAPITCE